MPSAKRWQAGKVLKVMVFIFFINLINFLLYKLEKLLLRIFRTAAFRHPFDKRLKFIFFQKSAQFLFVKIVNFGIGEFEWKFDIGFDCG